MARSRWATASACSIALRVGHREHVDGVVVVGILVADQAQMRDRLIVLAAVDRQRGGVQPFFDRLRRRFAVRRLTLTDVQVEPYAFVQLCSSGYWRSTDSSRLAASA